MSWYQNSSQNGVLVVGVGMVSRVCNSMAPYRFCIGCAVAVYQQWQFGFVCSLFEEISHHSSGGKLQFILIYCYVRALSMITEESAVIFK
jgi:hypothetical protein